MENIISFLQKLFFPWRCLGCGEFDAIICSRCRQKLDFLESRAWTSVRNGEILSIYSFFDYQEPSALLRRLIKLLKYQNMESLVKFFEDFLLREKNLFRKDKGFEGKLYYVPVPLHSRRYCERGFNQATLLAKLFQKIWPGVLVENLLSRKEYTIPQAKLNQVDRLENLQGKFILNNKILEKLDKNAKFVLVDDVITTASTMWALVAELKKAGIHNCLALSLARD